MFRDSGSGHGGRSLPPDYTEVLLRRGDAKPCVSLEESEGHDEWWGEEKLSDYDDSRSRPFLDYRSPNSGTGETESGNR
ncbi:hypothetical protein GCM10027160_52290 [Streptomyces calidiresistens]